MLSPSNKAFALAFLVSFSKNPTAPQIINNPAYNNTAISNPYSCSRIIPVTIGQHIAAILAQIFANPVPIFLISVIYDSGVIV